MKELIASAPRFLFFTGKGGVGKTSMSCALAVSLSAQGKTVLLISTDPASNLDEVLGTELTNKPTPVIGQGGLFAMNIDPIKAAEAYRERIVGPYRDMLPAEAVASIEEQLSGACTVEIASFNEFSQLIGDDAAVADYDHIVLDTAPTGHTLRLLSLPAAWNDFIINNTSGSSCLGPLAGLQDQRQVYENAVNALKDAERTLLVLVARAEQMTLKEAARASQELNEQGMVRQHLVINGRFRTDESDGIAQAFAEKAASAISGMPDVLVDLPRTEVGFNPHGLVGLDTLRETVSDMPVSVNPDSLVHLQANASEILSKLDSWQELLTDLEARGSGVIMLMGKGGVGKTSMAAALASELVRRGHTAQLSTTDPAAHIAETVGDVPGLHISRIDPKHEVEVYVEETLAKNRDTLSQDDLALMEEEMRSPCIEEIAVFQAFARTVAKGTDEFMVLDTAPTGHTLLLLDATEAYHREVARSTSDLSEEVKSLLPRLRDPDFTKVLIVTLPEATPVHEAQRLQEDLRRAQIEPYGWIINQSFAVSGTTDPLLCTRGMNELTYIQETASTLAKRTVISPWIAADLTGSDTLKALFGNG